MNESVAQLYALGKKDTRYIIGLMSGTSLDGLDVAMCELRGNGRNTKLSLLQFTTVPYGDEYKDEIKTVFSKRNIDLEKLCLLNEWTGIQHATIVNACLQKWNVQKESIDLIASHGQTIYHAPKHQHQREKFGNGTLQIGDGDHIAVHTGIITVSDFRQKHIAADGEGAPLAAYGDYLLFSDEEQDVILLNIGGIANFTFLPAGAAFNEIISSDIGPGNTMMDAYIQTHFPGKYFDEDANLAKMGMVVESLLSALKKNNFLKAPFPKTTGPELFNMPYLQAALEETGITEIPHHDIMATLNAFTATLIAEAILSLGVNAASTKVFVSGGGSYNHLLMDNLKKRMPGIDLASTHEKNVDPDAKEAILFAILANECVAGNSDSFGAGTAHSPVISMGKISFPD